MPQVRLNGIDVNYTEVGSGETILLLHNVVSSIDAYTDNILYLSKYFRVIACDLRGHGKTTHVNDEDQAPAFYNLESIAEDLRQLLDHLKVERCFVVGQAYWGVSAAGHLFDLDPDRIQGMVFASSGLFSTDAGVAPYEILPPAKVQNFRRMVSLAREKGMMGVFEERLRSKQFWSERVLGTPEILARFEAMHHATSPTAFAHFPHFSHEKKRSILDKIKRRSLPVMLLIGEDDSDTDIVYRTARDDYPGTHVSILPECGHYLAIENPHDFNLAICDFVAGALLRASHTGGSVA